MKYTRFVPILTWALGILASVVVFAGCASFTPYEESVLIEAGFQPVSTSGNGVYAALPPYKVQHVSGPGKVAYAYRNDAKGLTYLGDEAEYQRYQELLREKGQQRVDVVNREMNQEGLHLR